MDLNMCRTLIKTNKMLALYSRTQAKHAKQMKNRAALRQGIWHSTGSFVLLALPLKLRGMKKKEKGLDTQNRNITVKT